MITLLLISIHFRVICDVFTGSINVLKDEANCQHIISMTNNV